MKCGKSERKREREGEGEIKKKEREGEGEGVGVGVGERKGEKERYSRAYFVNESGLKQVWSTFSLSMEVESYSSVTAHSQVVVHCQFLHTTI